MNTLLVNNLDKITTLCKAHKVTIMYAIGSILTNDFTKDSDVDFIELLRLDAGQVKKLNTNTEYSVIKDYLAQLTARHLLFLRNVKTVKIVLPSEETKILTLP